MIEDKNPQRTPLSELGEFRLIEHLTQNFKINHKSTILGIGDDAAILDSEKKQIVVSTDLLVEGIHFDLSYVRGADGNDYLFQQCMFFMGCNL